MKNDIIYDVACQVFVTFLTFQRYFNMMSSL